MKNLVVILADSPIKPSGGLGIRFIKLLPHLEKEFNVTVFCNGEGGVVSKTRCIGLNHDASCGYSYPLMWSEQIFEKCDVKPDIVLCSDHCTIIPAKNLARAHKAKFVVEFDLAYFSYKKAFNEAELVNTEYEPLSKVIKEVEKIGIESSDLVITCSEYYKKELPLGYKRAEAVPNGIELEDFDSPTNPYPFQGSSRNNLVYIGRLNTQKGIHLLTDFRERRVGGKPYTLKQPDGLFAKLPPNTSLHFVGGEVASDQYKAVLESCKANPNSKYHIPFLSGKDKAAVIKGADAILFPSIHEPFGIVGLEAFAARTPLITTGQGGISDYANETNSIICENNAKGVEDGINKLLNMSQSDKTIMLANARETASLYSWDKMANKMIDLLKSV